MLTNDRRGLGEPRRLPILEENGWIVPFTDRVIAVSKSSSAIPRLAENHHGGAGWRGLLDEQWNRSDARMHAEAEGTPAARDATQA